MNIIKSVLFLTLVITTQGLLKTCSPTFHEKFLSSGDEIKMRWEYCTKMTFQRSGYSEWHSWATYSYRDYFDKLYTNYLMDTKVKDPERMDPTQHILTIDLAIYDEVQW